MKSFRLCLFLVFTALSFSLFAVSSSIPPEIETQVKQSFTKALPSLKIDHIEASPIPNLYQVISGPVVMYVTPDGRYAISGDILNLQDGKTNLTYKRRQTALTQALDDLGDTNMVVFAPPPSVTKPQHTVTVFTDPDCTYCQKFHANIDKINALGIKVRYVAFPRSGKNTPAYDDLVSVWCAPDKKAAFSDAMSKKLKPLKCTTHSVDKQFRLGALAGVEGTPTSVIEGQLVPGYMEPDELLKTIQQMKGENQRK